MSIKRVTCEAPVNIALIKYWGKREESLVLPINSSLSVTLNLDVLHAKTTVCISNKYTEDKIWLNGKEENIQNKRLQSVLKEMRRRACKRSSSGELKVDYIRNRIHICSMNNFPTAAGLASSAAGYACLVKTLAELFNINEEVGDIARQGSGSACRSMLGGFVEWTKGEQDDGKDSIPVQHFDENHWPELRVLILVVSEKKKKTASTVGMQKSVETSDMINYRAREIVPKRLELIIDAIRRKDFNQFAEITMKDSNQFHAICQDTYPPIYYMNDISKNIVRFVHRYNTIFGENKAAYTFDAGPNACIYILQENVSHFYGLMRHFFPPKDDFDFVKGKEIRNYSGNENDVKKIDIDISPGDIQYIIHTDVGPGPQILLENAEHLIDCEGRPIHVLH